jgi:hypothetical protein
MVSLVKLTDSGRRYESGMLLTGRNTKAASRCLFEVQPEFVT